MSVLELICPECELVVDGTEADRISLICCPICRRKGKIVGLMLVDRYEAEKRHQELTKRMFCRNCNYIGVVEEFSFDWLSNDSGRHRCCHRCHSTDLVNMAEVAMCATCDEAPALQKNTVCAYCRDQETLAITDTANVVAMCENCRKNQAVEGDEWCKRCIAAQSERKRKPKKILFSRRP